MKNNKEPNLNYYFLNRFLHPKPYPGFRQSIVALIINKNETENQNKFLFIQERTGFWFFPKGAIIGKNLADDFFESLATLLEKELGLRGMDVYKIKPNFTQIAYIFDYERQKYNSERSQQEKDRGNPSKGKVYHLVIMHYEGDDSFNLKTDDKLDVLDYKWLNQEEAEEIINKNVELIEENPGYTEGYQKFQKKYFIKILKTYDTIEVLKSETGAIQRKLL